MAAVPGYTVEQLAETVDNNDTDINASFTARQAEGWLASFFVLWTDNTKIIIIYTRPYSIDT